MLVRLPGRLTWWLFIRWLHVLAMALFVGGQMLLAFAVVPVERSAPDRERLRAVARPPARGGAGRRPPPLRLADARGHCRPARDGRGHGLALRPLGRWDPA